MNINRENLKVGEYYVLKVDMRTGEATVSQYHNNYTRALESATHNYSPDWGHKMVVVEVQGVVQGHGVPDVVTTLTRKL